MTISQADIHAIAAQLKALGGGLNKNLDINRNIKAYHRMEAEQSRKSVCEAAGIDPDSGRMPDVDRAFPRAVYFPDGERAAKNQAQLDQMVAEGGSLTVVARSNQPSELDIIKKELAEAKIELRKAKKSA